MKPRLVRWLLLSVLLSCGAGAITSPAQTFTTLATFTGPNGAYPYASLIVGPDGNFYGTTFGGGSSNGPCEPPGDGCGTIFKVTPSGNLTTLYNFCSQTNCQDGYAPWGSLTLGSDGNFYGTTTNGGPINRGTFFRVTPSGTLTTLHGFQGIEGGGSRGGLVLASDGNFYGTSTSGGNHSDGAIYRITPAGQVTVIYSFAGADGASPEAGLIQATDGNLYGTTAYGGVGNSGTVFRVTLNGVLTTLNSSNAGMSMAPLMQASDGNLYGVTTLGGDQGNNGTIFRITLDGTWTQLYSFAGTNGSNPQAALIQATDGNFYGTTWSGGANGFGTVFQFTPAGLLYTLHSFSLTDGGFLQAGLLQAPNGNLYGVASGVNTPCNFGVCGTVFSLTNIAPNAFRFTPVTPCRLVDTRSQSGGGPIQGGTFQTFSLSQLAQIYGCADLSTATTYSLNVTLVPVNNEPVGYLTIWPAGSPQPTTSTMNSPDGRTKANAAIVPAGANSSVNVYVSNTANVILDIDGYYGPSGSSTLEFYPLLPCRVVDTRWADGPLGGPYLSAGQARDFPVLSSNCQIPDTAQAYSMNFTVVPYDNQQLGYLTVWPTGSSQPVVSTLNNLTRTVVANAAIVPAGSNGEISVYPSGNTQLIVDINGYFAASGAGGQSLYLTAPCRVIDTRQGNGAFSGKLTVNVSGSTCAPPSNAQGYVLNATVVPSPTLNYLTLWADAQPQPLVSTLNAIDGKITSNMAIVPNVNGIIDAFAAGSTQLILDISGYFAP